MRSNGLQAYKPTSLQGLVKAVPDVVDFRGSGNDGHLEEEARDQDRLLHRIHERNHGSAQGIQIRLGWAWD